MPIKHGTNERYIGNFATGNWQYIRHGNTDVYPYNFNFANGVPHGIMGDGAWYDEPIWSGPTLTRTSSNPNAPGNIYSNTSARFYPHDSISIATPNNKFKSIYKPSDATALADFTYSQKNYTLALTAGYKYSGGIGTTIPSGRSYYDASLIVTGLVYVTKSTSVLGKNGVTSISFTTSSQARTASTGNPVATAFSGTATSAYLRSASYNGTSTTLTFRIYGTANTSVGITIEFCYEGFYVEDPDISIIDYPQYVDIVLYNDTDSNRIYYFRCEVITSGNDAYYDADGNELSEEEQDRWMTTVTVAPGSSVTIRVSTWSSGYDDYCELWGVEFECFASVSVSTGVGIINWLSEPYLAEW